MPNPFDLRGPEFLVFYVILGVIVTATVAALRRTSEPDIAGAGPLTEYLKIAYLRGGADEAVRVAILALIDRGLVEVVDDNQLKATQASLPAGLQRTEQRLLENCKEPTRASEILSDPSLRLTATTECEAQLVRAGLLPDETVRANRQWLLIVALLLLGLVAFSKILVALSRGRTNIVLLIAACVVFGWIVYRVANPFRTQAGEAMLADLRILFSALQDRARSISVPTGSNDLALLAAVFGMGALPAGFGYAEKLFQRPGSQASGSSCGSSCGSGSGGSSCGGGCGGGCGGCGG